MEVMDRTDNLPALVVTPHPLTLQDQRILSAAAAEFMPGETLAVLLVRHGVEEGQQWHVTIDGLEVPEAMWRHTHPKHGTLIECRRVPERDALRLAAIIALSYVTFGSTAVFGINAAAALGSTGLLLVKGALYLAGSMVINKMLAPKQRARVETTTSPTYSLTAGGRNRARPFEPLALVLGEPYAVPDLGAQPYTFFADGEQHLWQIFNLGINCADALSPRIGQTAITEYQGVLLLRNGLASANSDFPALGTSVDSIAGSVLTAPGGTGTWVIRTTSAGTVRIALDFAAQLFSVNRDGAFTSRTLALDAEYRLVGSGTWTPLTPAVVGSPAVTVEKTGWTNDESQNPYTYWEVVSPEIPGVPAGRINLSNASQAPLRRTIELAVPGGQYEVRVRKVDADYNSSEGSNQVEWAQLRSYQVDTGNYDAQARLAIRIQASGQLNGTLDELNAVLRAKPMPYWNGSAWVTATDRASGLCNPGAIFLMLARGIYRSDGRLIAGLGKSDDQIDIEGLKRFMVRCAAKGFEFDLYVQEGMSAESLMESIAYAGLGELAWSDGRLGVLFFSEDDPIERVINMANIKAKSFSVSYETMPTAQELEFQFFDRARGNAWRSLRVLAPGVTTPRSTATVPISGVTLESHAATLARFAMAQNIYQRTSVSLEMDLEYMTFRRGAVVAVSHDLTQWGYSGRLLDCQQVGGEVILTLDDRAPSQNPLGSSGVRYIGLRLPGETQMRSFPVKPFAGEGRVVVLDAAWPGGVPLPGSGVDNPAHDTIWIYDFKAVPGQRMVVTSIEPSGDAARLTLAPMPAEFWSYVATGAYTPPPNNSLLRPRPMVQNVLPSETLARQGNTYYTRLSLSFEVLGPFSGVELWGAVGAGEVTPTLYKLADSRSQSVSWTGGLDERWHLELRVNGDVQAAEPYRLIYDVRGLRAPPPPFDLFTVLAQPDGTRQFNFAYTSTPAPVDWLGAEIRYLHGSHVTPEWDDMLQLQVESTHYTASPVEVNQLLSGVHTFACRSLDTTGNQSTLKYFQLDLPPRRLGDVVAEMDDRAEGWPGTRSNCEVNLATGGIEAINLTTWADLTTWTAWERWSMLAASPISYVTPVRDLKAVLTCLVDVGVAIVGTPSIELRSSETSDDPVADPGEWSSWGAADVKVVARYIQVRVTATTTGGAPIPMINALSYVVSAPVLNDYINDVDISALTGSYRIGTGDVRAPLPNTYSTLLEFQAVIQDPRAGTWSYQVLDKVLTYGPRVQFKLNGTLTDPALVDFIVKGF